MLKEQAFEKSSPVVSVVVPAYNATETIRETLDSVFEQTYPNLEVIVVNDGSKDETISTLEEYKHTLSTNNQDRLRIIDQPNSGVSAARNNGVEVSHGEFIAFLDADDLWGLDKIVRQVEQLRSSDHPENSISMTGTEIFNYPKGVEHEMNPFCKAMFGNDFLSNPSGWMLSRSLFDRIGGFDIKISAMEDLDFLMTIKKSGGEFLQIEENLTKYRWPEDGKSYTNWQDSHWRYFEKHAGYLKQELSEEGFDTVCDYYREQFGTERVVDFLCSLKGNSDIQISPNPPH